jgi:hypothetical protein
MSSHGRILGWSAIMSLGILSACGGGMSVKNDSGPGPRVATVSGTVLFKGAPLPGATVYAWQTNTNAVVQTAMTDASGNYSLPNLPAGGDVPAEYQFWATKAGYGFYPSAGSEAKVMRAGMNGQFAGLNTANPPIIFAVIDWVPAPYSSMSGADFIAYDGSNPPLTIGATGQSVSYVSGDDGALHKGASWPATRFTPNQNGTVTDNLTGLIWLQNAGCFASANWATALKDVNALASGTCGLSDGSTAGTWRLPNLIELESIVDVSASNPALTAGNPFLNVSTGIYWTSTPYYGGEPGFDGETGSISAWTIRFSDGRYINDGVSNLMATSSNAVWAVKGAASTLKLATTGFNVAYVAGDDGTLQMGVGLTSPRWIDNGNGTVSDTMTGLLWLKQASCIQQPWAAALAVVNQLSSGQCGLTDGSAPGSWRMPNRKEMQSMADRMQTDEAAYFGYTILNLNNTIYQPPIFTNLGEGQYYWTSTTTAADNSEAWTVYSCDFGVYDQPKANTGYTLAVR